jgi:hypothetical protein
MEQRSTAAAKMDALAVIKKASAISVTVNTNYPIELVGAVTAVIVINVVHTRKRASK